MSPLLDSIVTWRITWSLGQSLWLGALLVATVSIVDILLRRHGAAMRGHLHLAALVTLGASLPVFYASAPTDFFSGSSASMSDLTSQTGSPRQARKEHGHSAAFEPVETRGPTTDLAADHSNTSERIRSEGTSEKPTASDREATSRVHAPQHGIAGRQQLGELVRKASPWIAGGYLVGVALMLARLGLAVRGSRRLRRASTILSERELPAGFALRCQRMGLRCAPIVARCERVAAPVVIGVLQPMILAPTTLFTGLPPDQLLDVLTHELAHLRRYDHWVLLVQRVVEVLLFFHPAAWWLSRRVEALRELSCDDRVVAAGSDPLAYVEALVRVAELSLDDARRRAELAALAADGGSPSRLRRRIARLLGADDEPSLRLSGGACAVVVVAVGAVFVGLLPIAPGPASPTIAAESPQHESHETRPTPRQLISVQGKVHSDEGVQKERRLEVLAHEEGRVLGRTKTDDEGRFVFRDLSVFRLPGQHWRDRVQFVVHVPDQYYGVGRVIAPKQDVGVEPAVEPAIHDVTIELLACRQEITGQVVDPLQRPMVGARVLAYGWLPSVRETDWPAPSAVTDAQGKFTLRVPEARFHDCMFLHPNAARTIQSITKTSPPIVLLPAGAIAGRVTEKVSGRLLSGVPIRVQSLSERDGRRSFGMTVTDDQGRYEIRGLRPDDYAVRIGTYHNDLRLVPELSRPIAVKQDETNQVDLPFSMGRRVRGRVVEAPDGGPVPGVVVSALVESVPGQTSDHWTTSDQTGADGAFELFVPAGVCEIKTYVPMDAPYRSQLEESSRTLDIVAEGAPVDVALKLGRPTTRPSPRGIMGGFGKVESPSAPKSPAAPSPPLSTPKLSIRLRTDQPVGDHVLRVVFRNSSTVNEWSLVSGKVFEKEFTLNEIDRFARLLIDVPGFAPIETPEFQIRPSMPTMELDLPPARVVPVEGRVSGEDGAPIVGARIQVRRIYYGRDSTFPWGVEATTDAAGRFVLGRLRAGEQIVVVVTRDDMGRFETEPARIEPVERFELPPITFAPPRDKIAGTVVDQDGLPVPKAEVSLARNPRVQVMADEQGRFELTGLPKGRSELKLRGPEGDETRHTVQSGTLDARLSLRVESLYNRPEHVLQVTLRAPPGSSLVKAKFFVVDRATNRWVLSSEGEVDAVKKLDLGTSIRTARERRFALVVLAPGFASVGPLPITVEPEVAPLSVDLRVAPAGTLRGRVVDENNRPVPSAKIGLSLTLAEPIRYEPWRYVGLTPDPMPSTDEEGRFELTGLPQGIEASIYVNRAGSAGAWSKRILVDSEQPTTLPDIVLRAATRTIRGRVTNGEGRPMANTRVFVQDILRVETQTAEDGTFELKDVADGELLVRAAAVGYESTAQRVTDEGRVPVELTLRRNPAIYLP